MALLREPYIERVEFGPTVAYRWLTKAGGAFLTGLFILSDGPEHHGAWIGAAIAATDAAGAGDPVLLPTPYDVDDDLWLFAEAFERAAPGVSYQLLFPADKPAAGIPRC